MDSGDLGPAEPVKRLSARILDSVVWIAITTGAAAPVGASYALWGTSGTDHGRWPQAVAGMLGVVGVVFYEIVFVALWGATPGKRLVGTQVKRVDHNQVGAVDGLKRISPLAVLGAIAVLVPMGADVANGLMLVVGLTSIALLFIDSQRRALWDYLAGTLVVNRSR